MKMDGFNHTEVIIEGGVIIIKQAKDYSYSSETIRIPVWAWFRFASGVDREIENLDKRKPDLADEAFKLMETLNKAKAEELGA